MYYIKQHKKGLATPKKAWTLPEATKSQAWKVSKTAN